MWYNYIHYNFGDDVMEVKNCKKCNKVFNYYTGYSMCPECKIEDERTYMKVREYVKTNPGVTIDQVSDALRVSMQLIIRYLREERLEIHERSNVVLVCEICGHSIKTGRFCDTCKGKIESGNLRDLNNATVEAKHYGESEENKVRFFKYKS